MSRCTRSPAELSALPYVEGILPADEAERFEEHYFDCPVCLEHLQTLQAMRAGMAKLSAEPAQAPSRKNMLSWPRMTWAIGSIGSIAAALLLIGFVYQSMSRSHGEPAVAQSAPAPATTPAASPNSAADSAAKTPTPAEPAQASAASLADLALPAFVAPTLRGDESDPQFENGMKSYSAGKCAGAISTLAQVPAQGRDALAAQFYRGVCQMHSRDLSAAQLTLRAVADAGDSPQQESAYYYLAQIALAQNDAPGAHKLLARTIALKGDLERPAKAEDRKLVKLLNADDKATTGKLKLK
jgi:hypothetical protein